MRYLKKGFFLMLIMLLSSCSNSNDINISLKGENSIIHEVNTEYIEQGVNVPAGYFVTTSDLDTTTLGEQVIRYEIIDDAGKIVEHLSRVVTIVDTTPPDYTVSDDLTFYAGIYFDEKDILIDYTDNYNEKSEIELKSNIEQAINYTESGNYFILIELTDSNNNTSTVQVEIEYIFDLFKLVENLIHQDIISGDIKTYSLDNSDYYDVRISNLETAWLFENEDIRYRYDLENSQFDLSDVTISCNLDNLRDCDIAIHLTNFGESNYTVAYIYNFDILTHSINTSTSFNLYIDKLDYGLIPLKQYFIEVYEHVIDEFRFFIEEILQLQIK